MTPIWKLELAIPNAFAKSGLFINKDKMNSVNPVNKSDKIRLKMMCFLPVVHYNLTKKVVQLSKKDVYLFEYQTYKYNEQLSSKLQ